MELQAAESIIKQIEAALEHDTRVNTYNADINVYVVNDQVILKGEVTDIVTKRAAVDAALRALHGNQAITDQLRLKTDQVRQDLELSQDVSRSLLDEPVFKDYSLYARASGQTETLRDTAAENQSIQVGVNNGDITLSGVVESLSHGRLAEVLSWWTEGCQFVDNQLRVVPSEQDNDNEITDAIRLVLEKDPLVPASQLQVGTAGGIVALRGSLATQEEKQLAIYDAWCVPGVADVVDQIETRD